MAFYKRQRHQFSNTLGITWDCKGFKYFAIKQLRFKMSNLYLEIERKKVHHAFIVSSWSHLIKKVRTPNLKF